MKKIVLLTLLAFIANFNFSISATAEDASVDTTGKIMTFTSACGGDVMFVYDLPRNDDGTIVFARTFDWIDGQQVDDNKLMQTSGSNICLPEGTGNVHRLRLGDGVEVDLPSRQAVTALVRFLEDESLAEIKRTEDAYGIKTASN
ncbi:MAG: hypothetical protein RLZZ70_357 [Candidatus Parcubacteria bacterium]